MTDTTTRALERASSTGDPTARRALWHALARSGDLPERTTDSTYPRIRIAGELYHVTRSHPTGWDGVDSIETEEGEDFILAPDSETAGHAARERWEDMAHNDPAEFRCMVGDDTLLAWALGQAAGPGSSLVCSLSEWLDLWLDTPEEEFAGYDGEEREVGRVGRLCDDLGYRPTVAYRTN